MKNWMKSLETLAGKLTAILAFAALIIIVLALIGSWIPMEYQTLVYVVAIGAMVIFVYQIFAGSRARSSAQTPPKGEQPEADEDEPSGEREAPLSEKDARTSYLTALMDDFRPLSLAGMDMHAGDTKARLPLEDIYISLNTTAQVEKEKGKKGKKNEREELLEQMGRGETEPLTALDALLRSKERHIVLLGAPGTGKSTFVRYLSLQMAKQLTDPSAKPLEGWKGKPLLPVAVSLGRFAEYLPADSKTGSAEMVEQFIRSTLEADQRTKDFAPHILERLLDEGGLILFDGLDEVANLDLRPVIVKSIESFTEKYARNPHSKFLVTCRIYSYQDARWKLTGWPVFELALFSPEQIERFIRIWYDLHTALESGRAAEFASKKIKLLAAVQADDPRRLYEVARYPIILTMMAIVHASHELPDSRARVYEQCVELLLDKWQFRRAIAPGRQEIRSLAEELKIPASAIYEPLYEIAFKAHVGHQAGKNRADDSGSLITEGLILGVLHDHLQNDEKERIFLEYCQKANGLLMLRGTITEAGSNVRRNDYTFPHLTFEEFLASRHLKNLDPDEVRRYLDDSHDRWREAVKFMAELYCFSKEPNRAAMNGLLESLSSPFPDQPKEQDWRALWLAGELLTYYKRVWKDRRKAASEDHIVANLRRLVFESPLTPRERADAADILDQLTQPEDLHAFVSFPEYQPPFFISKYPVTNAQYERFLIAENFQNKDLWINFPMYDENSAEMENRDWGDEAWEWLQQALQNENYESQDGVLLPRVWRDARFGANRAYAPVVGVSWYEANAYCRWLLKNWDALEEGRQGLPKPTLIRLPRESEWSEAAGGKEGDRFAFGRLQDARKEIVNFANTFESQINRTTPVWMYPQGKSPSGVMDLSGNVWEWQANYYGSSKTSMGLRGGSWNDDGDGARVAIRSDPAPPNLRDNNIGFRVALLPSG